MKFKSNSIMVTKLRLLLRLYNENVSQRKISKELELSRTSINAYLSRFLSSELKFSSLIELDDAALLKIAQGEIYKQESDYRLDLLKPLLPHYAKESKRRYVTIQLLWEEYKQKFKDDAYSYTTFKYHLQEHIKSHTYIYHNTHIPGDVLQVDFAGDSLYLTDKSTGDKISVSILCCTLPCSSFSFVYAMHNMSIENLLAGISKALQYINGVPQRILSDNMKQWVKHRDKYGPKFTDAALEFGVHYSTTIDATRVRKPKDKASVEGVVNHAYKRIYAKVRDEVFFCIEELNSRLIELLDEFNDRPMQNKEYSRRQFFELNEKDALSPLPDTVFSVKYTKFSKVANNYHIYISTHQYSVPYSFVNQRVSIVYDKDTVEIYDMNYNRIALHKRSFRQYGYTTIKEHMPPNHMAYEYHKGEKNAEHYLYRASKIDSSCEAIIQKVLNHALRVEQAYKSCEAILQLHKLEPTSFIDACKYADKNMMIVNYKIIKLIMKNRSYSKLLQQKISEQIVHENLRGSKGFIS